MAKLQPTTDRIEDRIMTEIDPDTGVPVSAIKAMKGAVRTGDVATVRQVGAEHPEVVSYVLRPLGTLLHTAARYPSTAMLQALLDLGVDRHHKIKGRFENALAQAASSGHVDNVRFLHEAGVEMDTGNNQTADPLWRACHAYVRPASRAGSGPVAQYLLDAGIPIVRYPATVRTGTLDAIDFAWLQGARHIARAIAMRETGGDEARVEELLAAAQTASLINTDPVEEDG